LGCQKPSRISNAVPSPSFRLALLRSLITVVEGFGILTREARRLAAGLLAAWSSWRWWPGVTRAPGWSPKLEGPCDGVMVARHDLEREAQRAGIRLASYGSYSEAGYPHAILLPEG
jgi:hypothetical protein